MFLDSLKNIYLSFFERYIYNFKIVFKLNTLIWLVLFFYYFFNDFVQCEDVDDINTGINTAFNNNLNTEFDDSSNVASEKQNNNSESVKELDSEFIARRDQNKNLVFFFLYLIISITWGYFIISDFFEGDDSDF